MLKPKIEAQTLLSTLWIFILFNMILRDLHEFPTEGYVEELISLKLSEKVMLFYGFMVEIPILMVLFSRLLNDTANKWTNMLAASIALLGILSTLPAADMDDVFFAIISSAALLAVMLTAWKLPTLDRTHL